MNKWMNPIYSETKQTNLFAAIYCLLFGMTFFNQTISQI